jgi:hypothetical protein
VRKEEEIIAADTSVNRVKADLAQTKLTDDGKNITLKISV